MKRLSLAIILGVLTVSLIGCNKESDIDIQDDIMMTHEDSFVPLQTPEKETEDKDSAQDSENSESKESLITTDNKPVELDVDYTESFETKSQLDILYENQKDSNEVEPEQTEEVEDETEITEVDETVYNFISIEQSDVINEIRAICKEYHYKTCTQFFEDGEDESNIYNSNDGCYYYNFNCDNNIWYVVSDGSKSVRFRGETILSDIENDDNDIVGDGEYSEEETEQQE